MTKRLLLYTLLAIALMTGLNLSVGPNAEEQHRIELWGTADPAIEGTN